MKITRTITKKKAIAVTLYKDGSVEEHEVSFVGDVKKAEKEFSKYENVKAVTLKDIEEKILIYAMDVKDFIRNAEIISELKDSEVTAE